MPKFRGEILRRLLSICNTVPPNIHDFHTTKQSLANDISLSESMQSHNPKQQPTCNTPTVNAHLSVNSKHVNFSERSPMPTTDTKAKTKSGACKLKCTLARKSLCNTQAKPNVTTEDSFPCQFCHAHYSHRSSLYKHIKSSHTNKPSEGGMKCQEPKCKFTCRFLNKLRQHLTLNHGIEMEVEQLQFDSWKGEVLSIHFIAHCITVYKSFPPHAYTPI